MRTCRTIYQADQDFERFGKTLTANFKDTATLWDFPRASLRQCHIRKLAHVGKDKTAWAKAEEYLTNLMDSDTMLTLANTDDAIKRAENYIQRQDKDDDKRVAFSSTQDGDTEDVQALRAELKAKDQRLAALEAKLTPFKDRARATTSVRKPARKECDYCKTRGKWFQGHDEAACLHKKRDEADAQLQAIEDKRPTRLATRPPARRKPMRLVL